MNIDSIAAEVLSAARGARQVPPFTTREPEFRLEDGYAVAARIRAERMAAGERRVGRKLGFTNRTIWPQYGVHAPIVGDLWHTTVNGTDEAAVGGFTEPLIEPEIAFGIARVPEPGMDDATLMACMDWVAHGFEVVRSIYPGWVFRAPDTVAAMALHGCYRIGPKHPVTSANAGEWAARLAGFSITLRRDGEVVERGHSSNVLGGPLEVIRHLLGLLAESRTDTKLEPGEMVTTGTLTKTPNIRPGEVWETEFDGLPLPGLRLRVVE